MLTQKVFLTAIAVAAWTASAALAQMPMTTPQPRQFTFPPVGLGSTETAEINVVNVASNSAAGTAASCAGNISFLNASGTALGTATAFTVTSGQAFSARLPFSSAATSGNRAVVRGVVQITPSTTTPRPPCALQFSFQTFDTTTGASHLLVTGSAGGGRY